MQTWTVAFHRRSSVKGVWAGKESLQTIFGHVSAYTCQPSGIWIFFDPEGRGTTIDAVTHDEAASRIADLMYRSCSLLRAPPRQKDIRLPLHPTMTCAAQCGALIGVRAYTVWGLHRKLTALGSEIVYAPQANSIEKQYPG